MHLGRALVILGVLEAAHALPVHSQAGSYVLRGIVVDERQVPIASAELTIVRDRRTLAVTRTDDKGMFSFENAERGTLQVAARRLGHKPLVTTINLDNRPDTEILRIVLPATPAHVEAVVVRSDGGRLDQFYEHKRENPFGRFIDRAEIEKSGVRLASDLFRTVPGASLRASRRYGNLIRLRGCQPIVWIDKVPIRDVELDEVTTPEEIAGLEVYTSATTVPPQYMDRGGRGCGAIVVWTRIN